MATVIVFSGEKVLEPYRQMSLRFRKMVRLCSILVDDICTDDLVIEGITREGMDEAIVCQSFRKSSLNGMLKVAEVMNEIYQYGHNDKAVAYVDGNKFKLRMGPNTSTVKERFHAS